MTTDKTVVITGATSGLGEEAAIAFAKAGWRVVITGRDTERGTAVVNKIRAEHATADFVSGDMFTIHGVQQLAEQVRKLAPKIDLVVNNAGGTFRTKDVTKDGLERTVALNVMAPYVFTEALLPALNNGARIVNIVTGVPHRASVTMNQLVGPESSAGMGAYVRAKLALLTLTQAQQQHYQAKGITAIALHPGVVPDTRFGQEMPAFLRAVGPFIAKLFRLASTREQVAARYLRVGTGTIESNGFYREDKFSPLPVQAQNAVFANDLWSKLDQLTHPSS